jgi:hypothetical protein
VQEPKRRLILTIVDFKSWSVWLSSISATGRSSPSNWTYRKCSGGKPFNLGARDNKVDDLFGPPYSSMMPNSQRGNETGISLQNGRNGKLFNSWHAKITKHTGKKEHRSQKMATNDLYEPKSSSCVPVMCMYGR